jgi:hypothetical protein
MAYTGEVRMDRPAAPGAADCFGAIGVRLAPAAEDATVTGRFGDGSPAVLTHPVGKGRAIYAATCPAIAYAKEAKFVPRALKEKWPPSLRAWINAAARAAGAPRLVELSHPVVEAGVYDAPAGTALVLANFTYERIPDLRVRLSVPRKPVRVVSAERGPVAFEAEGRAVTFTLDLGLNDIILLECKT